MGRVRTSSVPEPETDRKTTRCSVLRAVEQRVEGAALDPQRACVQGRGEFRVPALPAWAKPLPLTWLFALGGVTGWPNLGLGAAFAPSTRSH